MSAFITNDGQQDLKNKLNVLINASVELKFLVGFFYFSGINELYESLKKNPEITIKILVGLNVDLINKRLAEIDFDSKTKDSQKTDEFFGSIKKSFNNENFDTQEFYNQVQFFLHKLENNSLLIRKTDNPNHSKLYFFSLDDSQVTNNKCFITGSSNLTKAGLSGQHEFNVQISDFGTQDAEKYFDDLWAKSIKITEDDVVKLKLVEVIENETLVKKITPFEAYCYILKCYVDSYNTRKPDDRIKNLLERNKYIVYSYQIDAIEQALAMIEYNNGVLIADVVGLGKSIIASCIANSLGKRGLILCPPGLKGDDKKTQGWSKYKEDFELYNWEIRSTGDLEKVIELLKRHPNKYEVVIIDEVHKFRNQDTENYELLRNICRNKIVILLSATPLNNAPSDILSLLKLFITPKKSIITLDDNLEIKFAKLQISFNKLTFIIKNHKSKDSFKKSKAENYYYDIFGSGIVDLKLVKEAIKLIANQIRDIIEPVTIRRNRLDLTTHTVYKNEIRNLSKVRNPEEYFFELSKAQSQFYDLIIKSYFASPEDNGRFKGAIYRPFEYEEGIVGKSEEEIEILKKDKNREFLQQRNLFDIMRRMIVKRFESSFGAFEQTIKNFLDIYEKVLIFITNRGDGDPEKGDYLLDRKLLRKIVDILSGEDEDSDKIEVLINEYLAKIEHGVYPKSHKIYKIKNFIQSKLFIEDIHSDISMLKEILTKLDNYQLTENDPKSIAVFDNFETILNLKSNETEPKRKILIFSEYADTVKFVEKKLKSYKSKSNFHKRTLTVYGNLNESKRDLIEHNFNASADRQDDDYDIIITTDKLSEGFNLNRAGVVINYDIPWNPVRVIQRVGRINRIGKKVFDELMIVNFFPTEKGADYVRSREIASNKMFMIHNTLGEDIRIFDADEEPSPSDLFEKFRQSPDDNKEVNIYTKIFNLYNELLSKYPELVKKLDNLPPRIKTCKAYTDDEMLLFVMKNRIFVKSFRKDGNNIVSEIPLLEDVIEKIKCNPDTPAIDIDKDFWEIYEIAKLYKEEQKIPSSDQSIERKALNNLNYLINYKSHIPNLTQNFIKTIRDDIVDYGTLPEFTLRRIANLKTNDIKSCIEEIDKLQDELGSDYLDLVKQSKNIAEKEIIIAAMNKNLDKEQI
jgi:superfamily II DNA or RNA helicase